MSCLMQETKMKAHEKRRDDNIMRAFASESKSHNRSMSMKNVQLNIFSKDGIYTQTEAQFSSISHNLEQSEATLEGDLQIGECVPSLPLTRKSREHRKQKHSHHGEGNADENMKPIKRTRRSKKKTMQNVSTHNSVGYKATKEVSNWKIMYSRSTNEYWPRKHILSESPVTFEGACKVLDHILLKDVGMHVSVSQQITDDLSALKILLMDFMKRHKKHSPYTYLLTHHLKSKCKNKGVDIEQDTNSCQLESIGMNIKPGYKRQLIGHRKHILEQIKNMIEQFSNLFLTPQSEGVVQFSMSELAACLKSLEVAENPTVLQWKPVQNCQQTKTRPQQIEQSVVLAFVKELLRKVVPIELFGSKWNARMFERQCVRLTRSGKFQNFSLGSLMSGLKTSNVSWLRSVAEPAVKQNIFAKV